MNRKTTKFNLKLRDMCFIAIFTAIISVLAQVTIPMPLGVPLTLQTFAVMLAGIILGAKRAAIALFVYIMLGAIGVPVFTNFGGGFARIIGPWGGFIISFPVMAFVIGLCVETEKKSLLLLGLVLGVIINLSTGMFGLAFYSRATLQEAFWAAFAPFIVVEIIKIGMVFTIGVPVRHILKKGGFLQ